MFVLTLVVVRFEFIVRAMAPWCSVTSTLAYVVLVVLSSLDNIGSIRVVSTISKHSKQRHRLKRSLPTPDEAKLVLDTHNQMRATIGDEGDEPIPANMRYMTWDEGLAINAATYAKACVFKHSPPASRRTPVLNGNNGENLWGGSGELATDFDPIRAVRAWFNEYEYYEFYNHTCIPGKKCGHYTQVVWAESYKLGCGWILCSRLYAYGSFLTDAMYMVCHYAPSGNIEGEKLYKVGERCSQCDDGDICESGLCRNKERDKNIPVSSNASKIAGILVGVFLGLAILGAAGSYLYKKYHIQTKSLLAWRKRRRVSSAANLKDSCGDLSGENSVEVKPKSAEDFNGDEKSLSKQARGTRLASVQIESVGATLPD